MIHNSGTISKESKTAEGNNSKVIFIRTAGGTVARPNPNYNPKICNKCGKAKGIFHICK